MADNGYSSTRNILTPDPYLDHESMNEEGAGTVPALPASWPARYIRTLTGVDESLLDWVWEERARYTGLGSIVLGTAVMAMLSMMDLLFQVFGFAWFLIPVALFWGCFICMIDRWLIASTHGTLQGRWRIFIPRIILAVLFGIIISVPLVLTVFESAIIQNVKDYRISQIAAYESLLRRCNFSNLGAANSSAIRQPGCSNADLVVKNPATGAQQALRELLAQRKVLAGLVGNDQRALDALNRTARDECNGNHGVGLSGIVGVGPNCNRDRASADNFQSSSKLASRQDALASLDSRITQLETTLGSQTQNYNNAVTAAILAKVNKMRSAQAHIGLLERIQGVGRLAAASPIVLASLLLLGVFVVVVDCLPVLSKMISGTTTYDGLVERRLRAAQAVKDSRLKVGVRRATADSEIGLHQIESDVRARFEKIDEKSRVEKARRDAELDEEIAQLAAQLRNVGDSDG